jgi:hypothetical protein
MMDSREIEQLLRLAALIQKRNVIDAGIAQIIGRPAEKGHVGEYLASYLFDIEIEVSATRAGYDGRFRSGPLAGRSVNVKWYAKREGLLDIKPQHLPDYFLVLTGPRASAASSRGTTRPWLVKDIFLFESAALMNLLKDRNISIGIATSLRLKDWEAARIDTMLPDPRLRVSASAASQLLQLLGHVDDDKA